MAISVNWVTGVIYVPKADTTLVDAGPPEVRELDVDALRLTLRDLEDDPDGRPWPRTHNHNTQLTIGGVTYSRVFEIIPPYTIEFEDGQYGVNLYGANHNILDRRVQNQVSLNVSNSAGSTVPGMTEEQATTLIKSLLNGMVARQSTGYQEIFDDDGVTVWKKAPIYHDEDGVTPYQGDGIERRGPFVDP